MGGRAGGGASGGMGARSRGATQAQRNKVIGILKENRDSVISQIKYEYRTELKNGEKTLKGVMEEAVEVAVRQPYYTSQPNRMKTNLRKMVHDMYRSFVKQKVDEFNMKKYGTKNPKLSDVYASYKETTGQDSYVDWHVHKFGVKPQNRW